VLDVPFLRVRKPDHGDGAGVRARGDHGFDVLELERAVLHLKPGIIVVLRGLAIARDIELLLRELKICFPSSSFCLAVLYSFGSRLRLLCGRRDAEQRDGPKPQTAAATISL